MDILKLFFDHDLRLDKLTKRNANKTKQEVEASLADFMKPTPTFSKFYITGTRLEEEEFGINVLATYKDVIAQLDNVFTGKAFHTASGTFENLLKAISAVDVGQVMVIGEDAEKALPFEELEIDEESNVGHKKEPLRKLLEAGEYVLYKEQAHHGFDLHLFSQPNIYRSLFQTLQPLIGDDFRFFSINSKRMGSERHFYFETWTLDKPPHGAEEVFPDTQL